MTYIVYCHTNKSNGKRYIGITSQIASKRWGYGNGYRNNFHFYSAIKKYGWNGFDHEILYSGLTRYEAEQKEIETIRLYDCCNPEKGYNIELGGNSGQKFTEATKQKISNKLSGKPKSSEHRAHLSESRKGFVVSDETKSKISEKMSGVGNPMYGKKRPVEIFKTKSVVCEETGEIFISMADVSRKTGVDQGDISRACNGKLRIAGGCHWKFANAENRGG